MMPQSVFLVARGGAFLFILFFIFFVLFLNITSLWSPLKPQSFSFSVFSCSGSPLLQLHSPLSPPAPGFDSHLHADKEVKCGNAAARSYYIYSPNGCFHSPNRSGSQKAAPINQRHLYRRKKRREILTRGRSHAAADGALLPKNKNGGRSFERSPSGFCLCPNLLSISLSRHRLHLAWKNPLNPRVKRPQEAVLEEAEPGEVIGPQEELVLDLFTC